MEKRSDGKKNRPGANLLGKSLVKSARYFPSAPRTCQPKVFIKTFGWPLSTL